MAEVSERLTQIKACLRETRAPSLRRVNGIGNIVGGSHYDPAIAPLFFLAVVSTFLFVPLGRGDLYLVVERHPNVFRFYGSIAWEDFDRLYPGASGKVAKGNFGAAFRSIVFAILLLVAWILIATEFRRIF
ncbi:MAG TPA: hypothetical protein VH020_16655 [Stellaceae bacterium]|jgi:hypothetical protein|nr:hypothetical protein [Stellaceae bacterium]